MADIDRLMGMVPQRTVPRRGTIRFVRPGAARFTEPFYDHTLDKLVSAGVQSADLRFEQLRDIVGEQRPAPRAAVLHTGRCGSTLLTRMLAHDRSTLALSEPSPVAVLVKDAREHPGRRPQDEAAFSDLMVVFDRYAATQRQRPVVKFSSWVATEAAMVARLLPEAPLVFVHRPVTDVLASELHGRPRWIKSIRAEVRSGNCAIRRVDELPTDATDAEILSAMWTSAVEACLAFPPERMLFLGYEELVCEPTESLEKVKTHIGLPEAWNVSSAQSELRYYSKSKNPAEAFEPASRHARRDLPPDALARVLEVAGDVPARLAERR